MEPISKSTLRGSIIAAIILVIIVVFPNMYALFNPDPVVKITQLDPIKEQAYLDLKDEGGKHYRRYKKRKYTKPPQKFNPNEYSLEDWMNLGLSEKQSQVILKFTQRKLRSNEDLKRIFVINDELYNLIKDSTVYPEGNYQNQEYLLKKQEKEAMVLVNLNNATLEDLDRVPGIGLFYAKNILKYREALGGFYEVKQLSEVWKVEEEQWVQWSPYFVIDLKQLRKLNLNTATDKELAAHPYISWNLANSIVKLRSQNGPYTKIEEVKKSLLMDAVLYEKLKYYLKVEE